MKPKKTYPDFVVIVGVDHDCLVVVARGSTLERRVNRWGYVHGYWRPLSIRWVPWLQELVCGTSATNGRVVHIPRANLRELVLACETFSVPLSNGYIRRGQTLTDEEWAIISSLPHRPHKPMSQRRRRGGAS